MTKYFQAQLNFLLREKTMPREVFRSKNCVLQGNTFNSWVYECHWCIIYVVILNVIWYPLKKKKTKGCLKVLLDYFMYLCSWDCLVKNVVCQNGLWSKQMYDSVILCHMRWKLAYFCYVFMVKELPDWERLICKTPWNLDIIILRFDWSISRNSWASIQSIYWFVILRSKCNGCMI